jgi:dipeptidyl aminopeptidase/acylaminoacyl peptidase
MMAFRCLVLSVAMIFAGAVSAFSQSESFNYMDVFDLQFVADPVISPDGNTIVYLRHHFDVMTDRRYTNLWRIDFDGSNHRALTSGKNNFSRPVWSPDGTRLAYVSGEEGSSQIFVRWMDTGEHSSVTNLQESPSNLSWSPDGEYLLFSMRIPAEVKPIAKIPSAPRGAEWASGPLVIEHVQYRADGRSGFVGKGYHHIFKVSTDGGAPKQLTEGPFNFTNPLWAPEGNSILFTVDTTGNEDLDINNARIFEMDLRNGEMVQLIDERGPYNSPVISPDGNYIAYSGYEDEFKGYQLTKLYIANRDGTNRRVLSGDFQYDVSSLQWSYGSDAIYFRYDQEGVSKIGRMDLDGNYYELGSDLGSPSIGRPYGGGSFSVSENGRVAFPRLTAERPTELAVAQPGGRSSRAITDINKLFFEKRKVGVVEEFWVDSSVDDFKVHGWIIYPPDYEEGTAYPMILEIHGGPYQNYGPRFTPELQLMASQGYVVVYTNPRGSTSYGPEFASYINFNYPSEDHDDLMDAVDYVIERGIADPNNLFITGGSGGGVLTTWAIAKTDRFAAAVASKPVINWHSIALTADIYPFFTKYWFTAMPWEDPEQYLDRSPLMKVGNVNTPTMLLTGEEDYRTPMSESEQYYNALKLREVDAALVRFPDTPHNLVGRPSNLIRLVGHITGWFDRYRD